MESRDSLPNEADPERLEKVNQKENRPLFSIFRKKFKLKT